MPMSDVYCCHIIDDQLITVNLLGEVFNASGDPYQGEYVVTPSNQTQVLATAGKDLFQNITVNPIPSNYGLIAYNGFELTVS